MDRKFKHNMIDRTVMNIIDVAEKIGSKKVSLPNGDKLWVETYKFPSGEKLSVRYLENKIGGN